MFSIIIPTWNNLAFIKLCVKSIRKNSGYGHQVILHINDGSDGTLEWAKAEGLEYTHTPGNAGICVAVNYAAGLATKDYILYMNDDMYACPGWDTELVREIKSLRTDCFMLSSTQVEPTNYNNACVINHDFGKTVETFDEEGLLRECSAWQKDDWSGSTWPPNVVHKKYWHITGGYSLELSPGMSSDIDFSMKMWAAGCRIFKGVGNSKVYHFQSKSTQRITPNNGRKQFLMKWGINQSTLILKYLKRGEPYTGPLPEPDLKMVKREQLRGWLKNKIT